MKTAILGGGLTGLTLGFLLNKKREKCDIFEKEFNCGGLLRTLNEDGFVFDYGGSHIIFSKDKDVLYFMINLLEDNIIKNRRNTKILYKYHYIKYPFENGLSDLPKEDNFECLYHFVRNLIDKRETEFNDPKNLKGWFYHTFGRGIAEKYLIPYNEKIWKYPLEKISLEWVGRIPDPPVEDIIKSSLGLETEGYIHQLYFYYPREGGIQVLIKALEDNIKNNIITNFEVKKITKDGGKWIISNGKEEKMYDKIISTIPIFDLVDAMNAPINVKEAASNLKFNSLITVMIGLDILKVNDFSWLYIPDGDVLTHRVSFPSNYSPHVVPEGKSSVLAEITCNIGDEIWKQKDEEIARRIIKDLDRLNILNEKNVCFVKVKRMKYAYVINDIYYKKNVNIVYSYLKNEGVDFIGRFAEFKYLNMDNCIRHAMDCVG